MKTNKQKIAVFAAGTEHKDKGATGLRNLIVKSRSNNPEINFDVVAVISNYPYGSAKAIADEYGILFLHLGAPFTRERYIDVVEKSGADWFALSGWLKLVLGLDPAKTFNIHPGSTTRYGGKGMFGIHVHEAVVKAGDITTQATMHFVDEEYDKGPIVFRKFVDVKPTDTAEILQKNVNKVEHEYQPLITSMIVNGEISWDGENPDSLQVPQGYKWLK